MSDLIRVDSVPVGTGEDPWLNQRKRKVGTFCINLPGSRMKRSTRIGNARRRGCAVGQKVRRKATRSDFGRDIAQRNFPERKPETSVWPRLTEGQAGHGLPRAP